MQNARIAPRAPQARLTRSSRSSTKTPPRGVATQQRGCGEVGFFGSEEVLQFLLIAELEVERLAGELLMVTPKHNGDPRFQEGTRLADLGVTKKESHQWQAIAAVPEDEFREAIELQRGAGGVNFKNLEVAKWTSPPTRVGSDRRIGELLRGMPKRAGARDGKTGLHAATPLLADTGIEKTRSQASGKLR